MAGGEMYSHAMSDATPANSRPRASDLGIVVGILPPGELNAITDVAGVAVGHSTVLEGDSIRTGVTAILPHAGNLYQEKVPAAVFVGNAFGKLIGSTQVNELGEIETPILLTNTLAVSRAADALVDWCLGQAGNEKVRSINAIVGETNDGYLNDIRNRRIGCDDVFAALKSARGGAVDEGSIGAGTGTICFGWKGGIGTASRVIPRNIPAGGYTVGVLVQSNFGGVLTINGAPVGQSLGRYYLKDQLQSAGNTPDGSIMIIVATDAPLDHRNLHRLAARAIVGLGRTGSSMSNGSGDYVIAFSTKNRIASRDATRKVELLGNEAMSPLFQAVIEATEEAIYNSLFRATTITGVDGHRGDAIPIDRVNEILKKKKAGKED